MAGSRGYDAGRARPAGSLGGPGLRGWGRGGGVPSSFRRLGPAGQLRALEAQSPGPLSPGKVLVQGGHPKDETVASRQPALQGFVQWII